MLIAIGSTDILFALDSIPAVFGVTDEAYIVFVANAFALLGLRALFFLVKGLLDRLVYLSTGLAVILAFIGVKLILHWAHGIWPGAPEISTNVSLLVIVVVLTVTTIASLIKSKRDPDDKGARRLAAQPPRRRRDPPHWPSLTAGRGVADSGGTLMPAGRAPITVAAMSTLDDWIAQASTALDVPADSIITDLRNELLDLTRDVAHGVARIAGPLTCYLVGVAVGRGADLRPRPSPALTAAAASTRRAGEAAADERRPDDELALLDLLRRPGRLGGLAGPAGQATRLPDEHGDRHPRRRAGRVHLPLGDWRALELRLGLAELRRRLPRRARPAAGDQSGHQEHAARR